jgi:chorismate mutase/prephenate dehydratase
MSAAPLPRIGFLRPAKLTNGYTAAARFAAQRSGRLDGIDTAFQPVEFASHLEIIAAQSSGEIEFGVIAIENTIDGIIVESVKELERLFEQPQTRRTFVVWEELLPIKHLLMTQSGTLDGVTVIKSHPSALRQCSKIVQRLKDKLGIEAMQSPSTGIAVVEAVKDTALAAIGSQEALDFYGDRLRVVDLAEINATHGLDFEQTVRLADFTNGVTRFWVLGAESCLQNVQVPATEDVPAKNLNKTCFLFNLPNEIGTLERALRLISTQGIFLSVIYPFPRVERDFEYMFFVEVEGHINDEAMRTVQETLNERHPQRPGNPPSCVWLGSFPNTALLHQNPAHKASFQKAYYP